MSTLLVGFDAAWTAANLGALVGVLLRDDGAFQEFGPPRRVDYRQAEVIISQWQKMWSPASTIVLLDQPTIVENATGQRPVEHIVCSAVSLRHGGMQPANTARKDMFGEEAPVWTFLARFGGPADPLGAVVPTQVVETYPVLAMISLGWTLADSRRTGRLPKYNPQRRKTFSQSDWEHVCRVVSRALSEQGLARLSQWADEEAQNRSPRKSDQDCLDACVCLLVALQLASGTECLMVGNHQTGYIVVPDSMELRSELEVRCHATRRLPSEWIRVFRRRDAPPKHAT